MYASIQIISDTMILSFLSSPPRQKSLSLQPFEGTPTEAFCGW